MFVVRISADRPWEAGMLISPALAHGASGADVAGGFGPLILVVVAVVFVLVLWWVRRSGAGAGWRATANSGVAVRLDARV